MSFFSRIKGYILKIGKPTTPVVERNKTASSAIKTPFNSAKPKQTNSAFYAQHAKTTQETLHLKPRTCQPLAKVLPKNPRHLASALPESLTTDLLLKHFIQSAHQTRLSLADMLHDVCKIMGVEFKKSSLRSFEGHYQIKISAAEFSAVAESADSERATIESSLIILTRLLNDSNFISRAALQIESSKPSFYNLLAYHVLLTGVYPLIRITRKPPGDYEVEIRTHKVVNNQLMRGKVLGNWISSNLQDAYLRASREALVRMIAAKEDFSKSRLDFLSCMSHRNDNRTRSVVSGAC